MQNTNKPMTKREIINAISESTNLKTDVVKSVIDSFTDLFILETVSKGAFRLDRCFSVNTITRSARRQYNVHTERYEDFPETKVLSIKLAKDINRMHRWKQRIQNNEKEGITVDEFKERNKS